MDYNFALFNAISDALASIENTRAILIAAQQNAEEAYMDTSSQPEG